MADEFEECATASARASMLLDRRDADVRIKFCNGGWFSVHGSGRYA
jgi:hypothetical protein